MSQVNVTKSQGTPWPVAAGFPLATGLATSTPFSLWRRFTDEMERMLGSVMGRARGEMDVWARRLWKWPSTKENWL
jgi:hypothetical protein